jgi:hypothetical protein
MSVYQNFTIENLILCFIFRSLLFHIAISRNRIEQKMGIEGLHPLLKSAIHRVDIKTTEFRGTTCAVDTSFLLHRGAYACAGKLAQKETTDK